MCLHTVDEKINIVHNKKYGYKVFDTYNNNICGEYICRYYKLNKWYKASNKKLYGTYGKEYESGFHIFSSLDEAKSWKYFDFRELKVFKVEFKDVVATGKQDGKVIIAKKIKIIKEVFGIIKEEL